MNSLHWRIIMTITYRLATRDEVAEIIEPLIMDFITPLEEVFNRDAKVPDDIKEEQFERLWYGPRDNADTHFFGAFDDDKIVGVNAYTYVSPENSKSNREYLYLGHSYLDPNYRGKRIYSNLRAYKNKHAIARYPGMLAIHHAREDGITHSSLLKKGHKIATNAPDDDLVMVNNGIRYILLYTYATEELM